MIEIQRKKYNLEERVIIFAQNILGFSRSVQYDLVTEHILKQLIRSSTSIGANYMEAICASSKKDFRNKIYICKKESQETRYWLLLLRAYFPQKNPDIDRFLNEVYQFVLIFQKITSSMKILN